jgi:hypothetical protein
MKIDIENISNKWNKHEDNNNDLIQGIVSKFDKEPNKITLDPASVNELAPEDRVLKLTEMGILSDLDGYNWGCLGGDRFFVFANIKGVPIPMYRTSTRTEGKREGYNFFPFFGTREDKQGWLIKGNVTEDTNKFYGIKELEEVSRILTDAFNVDTDRLKRVENKNFNSKTDHPVEKYKDVDNFVSKGKEIKSANELNKLMESRFGIDYEDMKSAPAYDWESAAEKVLVGL